MSISSSAQLGSSEFLHILAKIRAERTCALILLRSLGFQRTSSGRARNLLGVGIVGIGFKWPWLHRRMSQWLFDREDFGCFHPFSAASHVRFNCASSHFWCFLTEHGARCGSNWATKLRRETKLALVRAGWNQDSKPGKARLGHADLADALAPGPTQPGFPDCIPAPWPQRGNSERLESEGFPIRVFVSRNT